MTEMLNQDSRPEQAQCPTREAWLHQAIEAFRSRFTEVGLPLPARLHVSVGFGYSSRAESKYILGQCWARRASADGVNHIFLGPQEGDPVLAAIQGERRWRGCVFAGERGFRGGSGCGGVACDDTVSVSDKGRPSPLPFCRSPGRAVRVLGGTIAHGRQQRGRRRVAPW